MRFPPCNAMTICPPLVVAFRIVPSMLLNVAFLLCIYLNPLGVTCTIALFFNRPIWMVEVAVSIPPYDKLANAPSCHLNTWVLVGNPNTINLTLSS